MYISPGLDRLGAWDRCSISELEQVAHHLPAPSNQGSAIGSSSLVSESTIHVFKSFEVARVGLSQQV